MEHTQFTITTMSKFGLKSTYFFVIELDYELHQQGRKFQIARWYLANGETCECIFYFKPMSFYKIRTRTNTINLKNLRIKIFFSISAGCDFYKQTNYLLIFNFPIYLKYFIL